MITKDGGEGSGVDTVAFPLQFAGARVVMLETAALVNMFDSLQNLFGTGGAVIIQQQGFSYGKAQAADLGKTLTRPYMMRNYKYGLMMLMATGWGIPTVLKANTNLTEVTVRMDECFECVGRKRGRVGAHFVSGYFAGIFSYLSGKALHGRETACVALGSDHCEIEVS